MWYNTPLSFYAALGIGEEEKAVGVEQSQCQTEEGKCYGFSYVIILLFYSCPPPSNNHPSFYAASGANKERGYHVGEGLPHAVATARAAMDMAIKGFGVGK